MENQEKPISLRSVSLLLCIIFVFGIAFRFTGLFYGYPLQRHTDEHAVVMPAIDMANRHTLLAQGFQRPDNIGKKVSSLLYRAYACVITGTGFWEPLDTSNETIYFMISRVYIACMGVVMIGLAWLILKRFSITAGVIGALLIAVYPPFVKHSHYVTPDIPAAVMMMLCMLFALRYEKRPTYGNLVLTVLWAALGTLDKYPAILSCGMIGLIIIACTWRDWRRMGKHIAFAVASYVLIMVVVSPNLFYRWREAYASIMNENRTEHIGHDGLSWAGNMKYYVEELLSNWKQLWPAFVLPFVYAVIAMIRKRERRYIVFTTFLFWWVLLSSRGLHWERWGVPMYAGALLVCAFGLGHFIDWLRGRKRWLARAAGVVLVLAIAYHPFSLSIGQIATFLAEDTRNLSLKTVKEYGMTKENSIYEGGTPFHPGATRSVNWPEHTRLEGDQLYIAEPGVRFIIQGSQRRFFEKRPEDYAEAFKKYDWLEENMEPLAVYKAKRNQYTETPVTLINALRKLDAVLFRGETTGNKVSFFDASGLPVWYTIKPEQLTAEDRPEEVTGDLAPDTPYAYAVDLRPGTYRLSVQGDSALGHIRWEVLDPENHSLVGAAQKDALEVTIGEQGTHTILIRNVSAQPVALESLELRQLS